MLDHGSRTRPSRQDFLSNKLDYPTLGTQVFLTKQENSSKKILSSCQRVLFALEGQDQVGNRAQLLKKFPSDNETLRKIKKELEDPTGRK